MVKTISELEERANTLIGVILHSANKNKRDLTKAVRYIQRLITGACICDQRRVYCV
jgi:hypothetical protein